MIRASLPCSTPRSRLGLKGPAALLAALLLPLGALPLAGQDLPDADDLIAAHVAAIGGADRFTGASSITRGTLAMPSAGIEGTLTLVQIAPNRMRMDVELSGLGTIQSGYDGEHGWSVNPMMGAQLMSGPELEQTREQASIAASLRDRSAVPERETVGEAEHEGQACWRVRLVWASGRESHDCYAKDTGLLLASESVQVSPMGEIQALSLFMDYREFDGRRIATRLVQRVMGQEQVMRIESVEYTEVDPARVAPPEAIQALIGG